MYPVLLQALLATVALVSRALSNPIAPLPNHQHFTVNSGSPANHSNGLPLHTPKKSVNRRGLALGVYECSGTSWTQPCTWTRADGSQCHNVQYTNDFSIGPDAGLKCTVYSAGDCLVTAEMSDEFVWPGVADSSYLTGTNKNAKVLSYKCFLSS